MNNDSLYVDPTSEVTSIEESTFAGRLGYLVLDRSVEQIVALTAAQMAGSALVRAGTSDAIGFSSSNRRLSDHRMERRPADTMLTPVILENHIALSDVQLRNADGEPLMPTKWVRDLATMLGQTVLVHTSKDTPRQARVTTTHGHFIMPVDDNDNDVHFSRAIELHSLDGEVLTQAGDAGCLVTSLNGDALGIVICGLGDVSYAAPVARLIDELEDCSGITYQMIANAKEQRLIETENDQKSEDEQTDQPDDELERLLADHKNAGTLDKVNTATAERVKERMF